MNFFRRKTEQSDLLLGPGKNIKHDRPAYGSTSCDDHARSSDGSDSNDYQIASLSGTSSGTYEMDDPECCRWNRERPNWIRTTIVLTHEDALNYLESQYLENGSSSNEGFLDSDESDEDSSLIVVPQGFKELTKMDVTSSDTTASTVSV